jgi:hypothetical protein
MANNILDDLIKGIASACRYHCDRTKADQGNGIH